MSTLPNGTGLSKTRDREAVAAENKTVRKRVASLNPSPENERIYRPVGDDPDIGGMMDSIRINGLFESLIITEDNYLISGHRRLEALRRLGRVWVPCRVLPVRRDSMPTDEFVVLLRELNRQRHKSVAEQVREELIDINPEEAHRRLRELQDKSVNAAEHNGVDALAIEGVKKRFKISGEKAKHVNFIQQIVEGRREYWPLSVRGVHYPLLNFDFIRGYYWPKRNQPGHGTRQELRYRNDDNSYQATSDLITRLRLDGTLPWKAFDDGTRPLKEFHAFENVRQYIRQEVRNLFRGYWRDLLQSQPNHIEVVCEKNTVYHMVLRLTSKYQIPTSSGRGFNSIDPWHDLYERYQASGKERLIVIVLSDFDPEGEMIPHVGWRTLRDDFDVDDLTVIKAGVTREQIDRYHLPSQNFAKETSSNHDWFVERNRGNDAVYELEALNPPDTLRDLDNVILSVLDIDLFNREVKAEQAEAAYLEAARTTAAEALQGLGE